MSANRRGFPVLRTRSRAAALLLPTALAIGIAAAPAVTRADGPQPYSDHITGDWGGLRIKLLNDGVDLDFNYTSESATNLQGGASRMGRYTDQLTFGTTLDLQKLVGVNNAIIQFTITDRNGNNLSTDAGLDSLQQVQEVFGRGQTWRLTQMWYDQNYFNDALDLKIGRLTEGEDFASFSCEFVNLTFCGAPPGNLVGNYWYNWPVSQWAARVKTNIAGFGYAQVGVYQVNPSYLNANGEINFGSPSGTTGALIPVEVGWMPTFGKQQLQGSYKFGGWYNTSREPDPAFNTDGGFISVDGGMPLQHNGAWGAYINFLQQLTKPSAADPNQGLSAFLNFTYADPQTSFLDGQLAMGVFYTGPFNSRPMDQVGLAIGGTHVTSRVANSEDAQNAAGLGPVGVQHTEYAAELYYNARLYNGVYLQPDFQYVLEPGGVSSNTNDIILALKAHLDF